MIINLGGSNSILNNFISQIRDINIQKDSMRFRRNMERIGEIFAYEISKKLNYTTISTQTILGVADIPTLSEPPVLATILRAGLPLHQGLLNYFDNSSNAFISAYRRHYKDGTFEIQIDYLSSPSLHNKTFILADPMLATGKSIVLAYKELVNFRGRPIHTHIVSAISSTEGVEYIKKNIPNDEFTLWTAAIDDELTVQAYIVPGLGDAGDLAYGTKSSE